MLRERNTDAFDYAKSGIDLAHDEQPRQHGAAAENGTPGHGSHRGSTAPRRLDIGLPGAAGRISAAVSTDEAGPSGRHAGTGHGDSCRTSRRSCPLHDLWPDSGAKELKSDAKGIELVRSRRRCGWPGVLKPSAPRLHGGNPERPERSARSAFGPLRDAGTADPRPLSRPSERVESKVPRPQCRCKQIVACPGDKIPLFWTNPPDWVAVRSRQHARADLVTEPTSLRCRTRRSSPCQSPTGRNGCHAAGSRSPNGCPGDCPGKRVRCFSHP